MSKTREQDPPWDPARAGFVADEMLLLARELNTEGLAALPRRPELQRLNTFHVLCHVKAYLNELEHRALENHEDAKSLTVLAKLCNKNILELADREPARFSEIVRGMIEFPCNWPALPKFQRRRQQKFKELGFAQGARFKVTGRKRFDPTKPANRIAIELIEKITAWQIEFKLYRKSREIEADLGGRNEKITFTDPLVRKAMALKPYGRKSANHWATVIWEFVLAYTSGHPENHSLLRPLGKCRGNHSMHDGQQKRTTKGTQEANIRQRIGERIRKAVLDLAGRA